LTARHNAESVTSLRTIQYEWVLVVTIARDGKNKVGFTGLSHNRSLFGMTSAKTPIRVPCDLILCRKGERIGVCRGEIR